MGKTPKCPICEQPAAPRDANAAFPFCSSRCRLIDLGNWLGESYRVPAREPDDAEEHPRPPSPTDDRGDGSGTHH